MDSALLKDQESAFLFSRNLTGFKIGKTDKFLV